MDKRDFFLLLQKLPINIIPSPCFEHTVDFVAQLAPWVPFSPLSLLTGQKSKLCLQVSNLLQLQDGGQLEVSAEHSAAHWRAADPRPAPLRAANDGSTLFLLLLLLLLLLLDLALQNCSSCPPPHSIPTDFRYLPDVYCIQHLRHYYFLIIRPYSYTSIISGSHFGHFDTSRHIKS